MESINKGTSLMEVFQNLGIGDNRLMPKTYIEKIDEVLLARMMQIGCTQEECSYVMGCTSMALGGYLKANVGHTFGELAEHHRQGIKVALRRKQIELALEGNVKLLIHLGEHVLGQVSGKADNLSFGNKGDSLTDATLIQIVNGTTNISGGRISHDTARQEKAMGVVGSDSEPKVVTGSRGMEG